MSVGFSSGTTPLQTNPQWVLECKILESLNNSQGGGTGTGTFSGTGSPEGVVTASVGAQYADVSSTANPGIWVKTSGSGSTGWANVIAVGP